MRDLVVGRDASSLLSDAVTGGGSNDEHGGVRDGHETAQPGSGWAVQVPGSGRRRISVHRAVG